jgi:exopolysaccharide biosynthesis polyprenyl glycosylphosphotransferase
MTSIGIDTPHLLKERPADGATAGSFEHSVSIQNRYEKLFTFVEALTDGITVAMAVGGGYVIYHSLGLGKRVNYPFGTIWVIACCMAAMYVILLDREGAYRPGNSLLRIRETERALRVSAQTFFLVLPVTFFIQYQFSRWVFLIALICGPTLLVAKKQLLLIGVRALRSRGIGVQRVLIYGAGASGRRIFSALVRSPKLGLNPVALVDDNPDLAGHQVFDYGYRHEHSVQIVSEPITKEFLESYRCEFLVIAIPGLDRRKFAATVQAARSAKVRIAYIPEQAEASEYWTERADIDGIMLSVVGRPARAWHYEAAKRPFDFADSCLLIAFLAPIWISIALFVKLDSPGPVLFRQKRVGRRGILFDLYKFRSMNVDSPKYDFSPQASDDPRITRVGRFLRRTSLDELPQLLNVLKGDMSLVGPRPEMPFIVEQYSPIHRQRLQVTPGITGLWQLSADRAFLIHENIQYDLYYIRNRSFFMDLAILLHTVVFAMRGV